MIPLPQLKQEIAAFRQLVRAAGREPQQVVVRSPGSVTVTRDSARVRQEAKATLAFYITNMGDFYREQLVRLGYDAAVRAIQEAWNAGGRAAGTAAVPDALIDDLHFAGPLEACLGRLAAQEEAGVDMHTVRVDTTDVHEARRILTRLVG